MAKCVGLQFAGHAIVELGLRGDSSEHYRVEGCESAELGNALYSVPDHTQLTLIPPLLLNMA